MSIVRKQLVCWLLVLFVSKFIYFLEKFLLFPLTRSSWGSYMVFLEHIKVNFVNFYPYHLFIPYLCWIHPKLFFFSSSNGFYLSDVVKVYLRQVNLCHSLRPQNDNLLLCIGPETFSSDCRDVYTLFLREPYFLSFFNK